MSISTIYAPVSYTGDGATTAFPVTWGITASSDIVVTETIIATGVETIKILTTHYTVTGTGPLTVTAVTAPAATVRWTIGRNVPSTQLVDYVENDSFPAETHEAALDKLTMLSQEHDQGFLRTLRQPDGDTANIDYLPPKITRASKYLGFDADGDPTALSAPTTTSLTTAFIETLLDDASQAAALTTLGVAAAAWTPTITAATVGDLSVVYSLQYGWVVKIHGLIILTFSVQFTPTYTTASGNLRISGAPYTNLGQPAPAGPVQVQGNVDATVSNFSLSMPGGGAAYLIVQKQKTATLTTVNITDFTSTTSGNVISGTLFYLTTA